MNNPSNPPEERLHECDRSGLLPVHSGWLEMMPEEDDLRAFIAHEAKVRVMFAVQRLSFGLGVKIDTIAEDHMPAEPFHEYQQFSGALSDLHVGKMDLAEDVISTVLINMPATLGTLEHMLQEALVGSGLCCELAADQLVSNHVRPVIQDLPGFQDDWLNLGSARSDRSEKRYPFVGVWPASDEDLPIDRPFMVAMGQDLGHVESDQATEALGEELGSALENALTMGPGRSVMTVVFDTPKGFQPPDHVSLDTDQSEIWCAMLSKDR